MRRLTTSRSRRALWGARGRFCSGRLTEDPAQPEHRAQNLHTKTPPRRTALCGSKVIRGRLVQAGICNISEIEGRPGPRKDAEVFAKEVCGRVFCDIRVSITTNDTNLVGYSTCCAKCMTIRSFSEPEALYIPTYIPSYPPMNLCLHLEKIYCCRIRVTL